MTSENIKAPENAKIFVAKVATILKEQPIPVD
jgi:hypothetical protein